MLQKLQNISYKKKASRRITIYVTHHIIGQERLSLKQKKPYLIILIVSMNNFIDLSSSLSADYEKLYESGKYTDISIHIGKEPNSKIFPAHTVVLCTRSKFLENSLTSNYNEETTEVVQKTMAFEDIKPDAFEILLRYCL